jgi:hypothetical protein
MIVHDPLVLSDPIMGTGLIVTYPADLGRAIQKLYDPPRKTNIAHTKKFSYILAERKTSRGP